MAEVWSARIVGTHPGEDRFFAVKLLAAHLVERQEYREMFLAEAQLSMMLRHPNIVEVYDAVAEETGCYMVMELVSGMTLSQFQRAMSRSGQPIPLHLSTFIIAELLRALSYAHTVRTEAGSIIVHRDVSPQNVMVTAEGEVKLMDFGIARFASEETQGAFVKGKLQYMPPEQLRKQTKKPTVDLYAVGAMLHELLDGQRFRGKLPQPELLRMVMHGEVPPLQDPTHVPSAVDMVRRGLLEADEHERIQTARKALGMLARWPGYREANSELCQYVSAFIDINSVFQIPESTKVSSIPEGSFSGVPVPSNTGSHPAASSDAQLDAGQAASTDPSGVELTGADDIPEVEAVLEPPPSSRSRGKSAPLILGGLLLVAALGGLGMVLVGLGDEPSEGESEQGTSEPASAGATAASEPAPEPTPEPESSAGADAAGSEPPSEGSEGSEEGSEAGPDELAEAEEEGGEPSADSADAPEPDEAELVPVEFVANEFFFVYVRVKGRVLALEPRRRIQLPPGTHRVQLRVDPEEKWKSAGRIEIEPGANYRVEMKKPASFNVVKK